MLPHEVIHACIFAGNEQAQLHVLTKALNLAASFRSPCWATAVGRGCSSFGSIAYGKSLGPSIPSSWTRQWTKPVLRQSESDQSAPRSASDYLSCRWGRILQQHGVRRLVVFIHASCVRRASTPPFWPPCMTKEWNCKFPMLIIPHESMRKPKDARLNP